MLKVLDDENQIQRAQQLFNQYLLSAFSEKVTGTVNCMGGKFTDILNYSPKLEMWYFYQLEDNKKHWHAFGIGNPNLGKGLRINSEINIAKSGINKSLSACFAENEKGEFYVLHRGKIRGGKALFFQYFQGQKIEAIDGKNPEEFALIGKIDDKIGELMAQFVREVVRIKESNK